MVDATEGWSIYTVFTDLRYKVNTFFSQKKMFLNAESIMLNFKTIYLGKFKKKYSMKI